MLAVTCKIFYLVGFKDSYSRLPVRTESVLEALQGVLHVNRLGGGCRLLRGVSRDRRAVGRLAPAEVDVPVAPLVVSEGHQFAVGSRNGVHNLSIAAFAVFVERFGVVDPRVTISDRDPVDAHKRLVVPAVLRAERLRQTDHGCIDCRDTALDALDELPLLDACDRLLGEVTGGFSPLVPFASDAAGAIRAGHTASGQALAAALVTTILQAHMGYDTLREAAESLVQDPGEVASDMFRAALITSCIPPVLGTFWPNRGDAVPDAYNRHASLHHVCDTQYTKVNALVAIMLVVALLREMHDLERRGLI